MAIPKFLNALYRIMTEEHKGIICWSHGGKAFQIRDVAKLERLILPKYFKHNKLSSFQRQLNYFGFRKWTKTQADVCTFSHPYFLKGQESNLKLITKKSALPTMENLENLPESILGKHNIKESATPPRARKQIRFEPSSPSFVTSWDFGLINSSDYTSGQLVDLFLLEDDIFDSTDAFVAEFELFLTPSFL